MRTVITYPNEKHPRCKGTVYVDEDADPDVTYMHYQDFWKPGMKKPRTFIVEVEKATGKAREVKALPQHFMVKKD